MPIRLFHLLGLAVSVTLLGGSLEAQVRDASGSVLGRALDRAVTRLVTRQDLLPHHGGGFNRDSLDVHAFKGLPKSDDTTLVGWFAGLATYLNQTDSASCATLTRSEPTGTYLASLSSTMDSSAIEHWVGHWERAVVASFLGENQPPVNEEEMMMAMFALIAKLPDVQVTTGTKQSSKPRKPNPDQECRNMREFFTLAQDLEAPARIALFRGIAEQMHTKSGPPQSRQ